MTQFTATKTGLKDQHLEQKPLFEKKYSPVEVEKELISRLYNDGSLYYLSDQKDDAEEGRFKPAWSFISTVFSGGSVKSKKNFSRFVKAI